MVKVDPAASGSFDPADAFRPFAENDADADLFPHPYARGYIGARG